VGQASGLLAYGGPFGSAAWHFYENGCRWEPKAPFPETGTAKLGAESPDDSCLATESSGWAISEARQRGIMGGGISDSLHATFPRRQGAKRIVTRNPSHFAYTAPELEVVAP